MVDARELAVHADRRAQHPPAEGLADALVAEADAEQRHPARGLLHQLQADAGLVGVAGAGRDHDRFRLHRQRLVRAQRVVAPDLDIGPELAQEVHQVVDEAVIVIDQQDHWAPPLPFSFRPSRPARSCTNCQATRPERPPRVTAHSFACRRSASLSTSRPKCAA